MVPFGKEITAGVSRAPITESQLPEILHVTCRAQVVRQTGEVRMIEDGDEVDSGS